MVDLINLGVTESIRLGNSNLVKMKIESMEKKLEIRKNKSKLAGTYIFIEDDKSYEERTIDWALRQIVREEIGKGKEVKRSYNSFRRLIEKMELGHLGRKTKGS